MDKIRVGIVGFGFIGRRHAHMINNNNFFELCAIADIKNKKMILNLIVLLLYHF